MSKMWRGTILEGDIARVKEIILETFRKSPLYLKQALVDMVEADGKMLRPGFLILSSAFGKADKNRILNLAAAVEILHLATLIHDDVIDNSGFRRGVATLHSRYGYRDAILSGDFLFSVCMSIVADYTVIGDAKLVSSAISHIVLSEINQWEVKKDTAESVRLYLRRIAGKTAALFLLSCHVGASQSEAPKDSAELLRRIGYNTGMAFQITDDILDYRGSEPSLRKPVGRDLSNGVITLPLVVALKKDPSLREALSKGVPPKPKRIPSLVKAVNACGAVEEASRVADIYSQRALAAASKLPDLPERTLLTTIIEKLTNRVS